MNKHTVNHIKVYALYQSYTSYESMRELFIFRKLKIYGALTSQPKSVL